MRTYCVTKPSHTLIYGIHPTIQVEKTKPSVTLEEIQVATIMNGT
jgi:hypothetical protein